MFVPVPQRKIEQFAMRGAGAGSCSMGSTARFWLQGKDARWVPLPRLAIGVETKLIFES